MTKTLDNDTKSHIRKTLPFFLFVFALSAPIWVIARLVEIKGLPLDVPVTDLIATFIPMLAACLLVFQTEGKMGVKRLLKRAFDFSKIPNKSWLLPAIFGMPAIYLLIYGAIFLLKLPLPVGFSIPFQRLPLLFVAIFIAAAGEEIGWSGFATEPMQARWGAGKAALFIGLIWAIWHYPSILQQGHGWGWIFWGTLGTIGVRVLMIWLFNNTGGSVFVCIVFHSMANFGRILFPKDLVLNPLVDYPGVHYSIIVIVAMLVATIFGLKPKVESRGNPTLEAP
jgi:uncharacterized protein